MVETLHATSKKHQKKMVETLHATSKKHQEEKTDGRDKACLV